MSLPRGLRLKSISMLNALGGVSSNDAPGNALLQRLTLEPAAVFDRFYCRTKEKSFPVAKVPVELEPLPEKLKPYHSRNLALSLTCLRPLVPEIELLKERFGVGRVGVVAGTSTSGIDEGEKAIAHSISSGKLPDSYHYSQQEIGSVSLAIAKALELSGPHYTVSTACSSSAKVFRSAAGLINSGLCDAVLVGGVDSLCNLTLHGFASLELLSEKVTNPFSENRAGINIGEAACFFIMIAEAGGIQLYSVGESSDAYHFSSPDPEGRGAESAITNALNSAELSASDINYLNLHGTGTPHNDLSEARAVSKIFGEKIAASSTKPLTGHTLGASGATEVGFCWLILNDFLSSPEAELKLPLHIYDGSYDPALPRLNLVEKPESLKLDRALCMSNSFGFGGSNCAVIIGADRSHA